MLIRESAGLLSMECSASNNGKPRWTTRTSANTSALRRTGERERESAMKGEQVCPCNNYSGTRARFTIIGGKRGDLVWTNMPIRCTVLTKELELGVQMLTK